MTFEEMFDEIQSTEEKSIYVKQEDLEKASKILSDAGIDNNIGYFTDMNTIGLLKENGMYKEKIMERIPKEFRSEMELNRIVANIDMVFENRLDIGNVREMSENAITNYCNAYYNQNSGGNK